MDPNQHLMAQQQQQQQQQPPPPPPPAAPTTSNKRRKKADSGNDEGAAPEPRRLRRSHEACARCRSKKIKASPDGRHRRQFPAILTSRSATRNIRAALPGTPCHQEDRHRQTLTPRGHTERIEHQVAQCEALLKRHIAGFELDKLDEICAREGIEVTVAPPSLTTPTFQFQQTSAFPRTGGPVGQQPMGPAQAGMYYPPPPPGYMGPPPPPGYGMMPPYAPFHPTLHMPPGPPGPYSPHLHPSFQPPPPGYMPPPPAHPPPPPPPPITAAATQVLPSHTKGTDPDGNDMSNTEALAKNFGVSAAIVNDLRLRLSPTTDKEDLAVGSHGLSSGRDRGYHEGAIPRDPAEWVRLLVRRNSTADPGLELPAPGDKSPSIDVWLPKDRKMVQHIVDGYFTRLHVHRPVFVRKDFEKTLNSLYEGLVVSHDPGYLCSLYLVLALGTLSELNHRASAADLNATSGDSQHLGSAVAKKFMPNWPEHDEFFGRALSVKPDLRVTISSLQALILLHWYLYTERQGRTLWRLVGSLVRLSIELGLHHDPTTQTQPVPPQAPGTPPSPPTKIFTHEESQLRIRLWSIVLVHDRGTSILLGRPLAISPNDSNTPHPARPKNWRGPCDFSEHFEHSMPLSDIQADIINSLYAPKKKQSADVIMCDATRIVNRMSEFRKGLPEKYSYYFSGTDDWPMDRRSQLVKEITEDEGLTLLKIGIARILLLRALFNSKELTYIQRHKALVDAIVTSHNMIVIHNQLIRFPDIAFFTSPIPLHIAAMVILYGHMSKCETLPRSTALEDVWSALDMLPRFRWRWERKDLNGGHPLIAKLAERVMEVDLASVGPITHPALLSEPEWEEESLPVPKSQPTTPIMGPTGYTNGTSTTAAAAAAGVLYGSRMNNGNGAANENSGGSTPPNEQLVDVPPHLFYPFYPETSATAVFPVPSPTGQQRDYTQLLAAAAEGQGPYGCQGSQDSFVSEERDPDQVSTQPGGMMWVDVSL
ncbi:hypothetical protein C0995_001245 [Termitomyces sp. Mi166|nr:hypothetical protein C0995_001245 [Termitomyces sp. Mi166\